MALVTLPLEIVVQIAEFLRYSDYKGFITYLEFRKTSRQLYHLLKIPTYSELFAHKEVFLSENLLPCNSCLRLRPSSTHFFNALRRDGIGSYTLFCNDILSSNSFTGPYHVQGEGSICIDCGVKDGRYAAGERFSLNVHGHFCVCTCCSGLGRSSIHMQVCSPCFDEDWGTSLEPAQCHRKGQRDRLLDLLVPARGGSSRPELFLPEI